MDEQSSHVVIQSESKHERAIRQLASRDRTSLNRAAVKLMRRGSELAERQDADVVGSSLDHLIGIWSSAEADEVDEAQLHFEPIDEGVWE